MGYDVVEEEPSSSFSSVVKSGHGFNLFSKIIDYYDNVFLTIG